MSALIPSDSPPKSKKLSGTLPRSQWPETVGETVEDLLSRLSPQDKEMIRATRREDLILFRRGLGRSISKHYGLNQGNRRLFMAACGRRCNPADAAFRIIESLWLRLRGN
ncbi:DUF6794 domain-containing protein [Undibacterium terreum]|nr:DUF6794 domain-containing protein [Undibacterium terreum]